MSNSDWNYQTVTGDNNLAPDNPSGHPMIVPQSTPTRQPMELPADRPAMVPRSALEAAEAACKARDKEIAMITRERDEARENAAAMSRIAAACQCPSKDAEIAILKRKRDEAREQRDRLAAALKMWKAEGPDSNACFCDAETIIIHAKSLYDKVSETITHCKNMIANLQEQAKSITDKEP